MILDIFAEKDFVKLEENAKKCMRLSALIVWALLVAIAAAACLLIAGPRLWVFLALGALAAIAAVYIAVAPRLRYERYRYKIDDEAIRVREGFIFLTEQIVPIERLHKLSLSQGPVARKFGFSTITVTTAGGEASIKFLTEEKAAEIAESLKKKINEAASAERAAQGAGESDEERARAETGESVEAGGRDGER